MKRTAKVLNFALCVAIFLSLIGVINFAEISANAETKTYEGYTYTVDTSTNEATITKYTPDGSDEKLLVIPNVFYETDSDGNITNSYDVTTIGSRAFTGKNVTNVVISDGITTIERFAFKDNLKLEKVVLPSDLKKIGQSAFRNCSSLQKIEIPDTVTSVEGGTFAGCSSLVTAILSENISEITSYLFNGCTSLESIEIPEKVTLINSNAFENCTSLTKITIPKNVTSIGDYAFNGCENVSEITIPDSVETIGTQAFSGCKGVSCVVLPSGITSIGEKSFADCGIFVDDFDNSLIYDFKLVGKKDSVVQAMAELEDITFMNYEEYEKYLQDLKDKEEEIKEKEENPIELPPIIKGDVNDDNKVNSSDAVIILKSYATVLAGGMQTLDSNYADINGDGNINSVDAVWILKYFAASMIDSDIGTIDDYMLNQ
jgi:hypothetical protein